MTIKMIETLMNIAIAERSKAQMNLNIYLANGTAIGEHPDVVEEANKLVAAVADADGKIEVLNNLVKELKNLEETKTKQ